MLSIYHVSKTIQQLIQLIYTNVGILSFLNTKIKHSYNVTI